MLSPIKEGSTQGRKRRGTKRGGGSSPIGGELSLLREGDAKKGVGVQKGTKKYYSKLGAHSTRRLSL